MTLIRVARALTLLGVLLSLAACEWTTDVSERPHIDWYGRVGAQGAMADVEAEDGNSTDFIEPGFSLTVGSFDLLEAFITQEYDRAWGIEGGYEKTYLGMDNGVDGVWTKYLLGGRYTYDLDKILKKNVTLGAAWHVIRFNVENTFSIDGFGGYAGYGIDYSLNQKWFLGLDLKAHVYRGRNDFEREWAIGSMLTFSLARFF